MTGLIIIISTFLALFILSFFTKRRFGLLGLGLAAGVLLNQLAGAWLVEPISTLGINFAPLETKDVVTMALTILPSLLMLITGDKQHGTVRRLLTSLLYALIATALITLPITKAFPVDDAMSRNILTLIENIQLPILTFGIILALVDLLLPRRKEKE
jgi:hypothetical protein